MLDGKIYAVGGCEGQCLVGATDVTAYDVATDTFEVLASYPEPVSWTSCGGIDGKVYCAGGLGMDSSGTNVKGTSHGYAYDPVSNTWSRIADLPLDLQASSYAVANGKLAVTGGIALGGPVRTNEGFAYDHETDRWTALPNSAWALWRGAATCGLYRIGGRYDARQMPFNEQLAGYDTCEQAGSDAPWLSESVVSGTLAPKASVTVTLTMNSKTLTQPGVYRSTLSVRENTPYAVAPVDVNARTARAPATWTRLSGAVTGRSCDGTITPLSEATIAIDHRTDSWTLSSGADGSYALWLPGGGPKARVVVAAPDHRPASIDLALRPGADTVLPFTLQALHC